MLAAGAACVGMGMHGSATIATDCCLGGCLAVLSAGGRSRIGDKRRKGEVPGASAMPKPGQARPRQQAVSKQAESRQPAGS